MVKEYIDFIELSVLFLLVSDPGARLLGMEELVTNQEIIKDSSFKAPYFK